MLQMLDLHLYKFPEDLEKKFSAELHNFLLHYGWVAKEAGKLGLLRYSMVQKHHLTAQHSSHLHWTDLTGARDADTSQLVVTS